MATHFLCCARDVQLLPHAILVRLKPWDFHPDTLPVLADELYDLARDHGRADVFLDPGAVTSLPGGAFSALTALRERLHGVRDSLVLLNVPGTVRATIEAAGRHDLLDLRGVHVPRPTR